MRGRFVMCNTCITVTNIMFESALKRLKNIKKTQGDICRNEIVVKRGWETFISFLRSSES